MSTVPSALDVRHVAKNFARKGQPPLRALDDVSFSVRAGTIHGLLGPNGAGKSTLINLISGVMRRDGGDLSVFGLPVGPEQEDTKKLMGVVPQEIVTEMPFSVYDVLYFYGGMYGVPAGERRARITEILADLELSDKADASARSLSGGMKRRLMVAKALLHRPKFIILDEPTAGVDVALRQRIWELVRRLNKEGATILFTTHYLEEAEQLCESITLINHGKVVKDGRLQDLQKEFSREVIHFELYRREVAHLDGVRAVGTMFEYDITHDLPHDLHAVASYYGENLKSIKSEEASLEQIFLHLTSGK